jgi:hypothetical protein
VYLYVALARHAVALAAVCWLQLAFTFNRFAAAERVVNMFQRKRKTALCWCVAANRDCFIVRSSEFRQPLSMCAISAAPLTPHQLGAPWCPSLIANTAAWTSRPCARTTTAIQALKLAARDWMGSCTRALTWYGDCALFLWALPLLDRQVLSQAHQSSKCGDSIQPVWLWCGRSGSLRRRDPQAEQRHSAGQVDTASAWTNGAATGALECWKGDSLASNQRRGRCAAALCVRPRGTPRAPGSVTGA